MKSKVPSHISGSFAAVTERGGAGETHVCLEGGGEEERIECVFRTEQHISVHELLTLRVADL